MGDRNGTLAGKAKICILFENRPEIISWAAFIALVVLCRVGPVSVDATRQLYIIGS